MTINFANIPKQLKELDQWVMWKWEERGGKRTKPPYQPNGGYARPNDASTFSSYLTCSTTYVKGGFDGIGFVLVEGDGLVGIDLDHCYDKDGKLKPWGQAIIDDFPREYIERSPSGDGLHIWCRGEPIRTGAKKRKDSEGVEYGIEIYTGKSPRYLTVTGDAIQRLHSSASEDASRMVVRV